jgi:hypothetical protein
MAEKGEQYSSPLIQPRRLLIFPYSSPFVHPDRWQKELVAAGFPGLASAIYDDETPFHLNAIMLARASEKEYSRNRITVLCEETKNAAVHDLRDHFSRLGVGVDVRAPWQPMPIDQDIISLLDWDLPFFQDISEQKWKDFKNLTTTAGSSAWLWITRSSEIGALDPCHGQILGLARTLRSELSLNIATLQMDSFDPALACKVFTVFQHQSQRDRSAASFEYEYMASQGRIYTPRIRPYSVNKSLLEPPSKTLSRHLDVAKTRRIGTIQWTSHDDTPLPDDHVEIEMKVVGLNFKVGHYANPKISALH